ncbi:hypothetical protein [Sphaerisporangium sp. TRM90804]|uniref:hypothetical protein n=1 Tax=Sphaerisporangium sp. TRM90804 TaxID=3031113 RepID=UPI00244C868D|nr:hypothetical protein [Sphaerisporangium sp. TRM90804]MDH2429931.1 hypothetical protein [Sphaerisporangium sp. TRM90804]
MRGIIQILVGVTFVGMLFAGSFLGALSNPEPHGVPVAVVGPPQVVERLAATLEQRRPGAFELSGHASEREARAALLDREVDGVLVSQAGRLVVAGAAGRTTVTVLTTVFGEAAKAQGGRLTVEDAVPLPPGDAGGVSGMFYTLALVVPGLALALLLAREAPGLGPGARVGVMALGSALVGAGNALLADVAFGALPGDLAALAAVSAALTLTIALVVAGLLRVVGVAGAGLAAILFIPIGLPAGGGPLGARFVPEWYAAIGQALPVSAGAEAVRNVVHFGGAALGAPAAVLGVWALAGLALLVAPARRGRDERVGAALPAATAGV